MLLLVGCAQSGGKKDGGYKDVRGVSYSMYCPPETAQARQVFASRCLDEDEVTTCKDMMQQVYCHKVLTINTGNWGSDVPCPETVLPQHKKACTTAGWQPNSKAKL